MKIAIIGVGFVGSTVADFLEQHGHTVVRVDPKYYDTTIAQATADAHGAIICVNTPSRPDGSCDGANVLHAYEEITRDIPIMVKSTVTPDIVVNWPNKIVTNPEFLREAHAAEDFKNQHTFVIGAEPAGREAAEFFQELFQPLLPHCEFVVVNRSTANTVKYVHNAWLATKVAFFHEMYSALPRDVDYRAMTGILANFPNIGSTHMQAPNSEGLLGYSGSCFPKDVSALNQFIDHSILRQVEATNENLKKKTVISDHHMMKLKERIPTKPFLMFIGTSHTYGECNGEHQPYTFAEHVAGQLGLECMNVGMSGALNIELLQVVNELNEIGAFNEHCQGVILEPRLTDNTAIVQTENYMNWPAIARGIQEHNKANVPVLAKTRIGELDVWHDNQIKHPVTLNEFLYIKLQSKNVDANKLKKIASGYLLEDDMANHLDRMMLERSVDKAEFDIAIESKNMYSAFQDLVIIQGIRNIISGKNIPFAWMLVDTRRPYLRALPEIYGGCSDIFDSLIFGDSAMEIILEHLGKSDISELNYLRCECHHLNREGNIILGELLVPEIRRIIDA